MNPDDIIKNALLSWPLPGEGFYIVEGNPQRNDIRILLSDQSFKDNLNCFAWNINTGYQYLGIFLEEKQADMYIKYILEEVHDEVGDQLLYGNSDKQIMELLSQKFIPGRHMFILEGHPQNNALRILPADEAFKDNLQCYIQKKETGFQYMGFFTEEKEAKKYMSQIRQVIRNEEGKRLL